MSVATTKVTSSTHHRPWRPWCRWWWWRRKKCIIGDGAGAGAGTEGNSPVALNDMTGGIEGAGAMGGGARGTGGGAAARCGGHW
uniref:Aic1 n=1 Tax=Arundo donax TaxID=35708 RepID=A0A0A9GB59_ARUDO